MNEVKRYDAGCDYAGEEEMVERADGDFVRYEDYAALKDSAMDYAYRWGKAQDDIKKAHMLHSMQKEEIANLKEQLTATTNSLTNAQEALKSAGIEADTVQAGVMELVNRMNQVVAENALMLADYRDIPEMRRIGAPLTPATDAYLNAVRADVLLQFFNEQMEWALVNWQWSNFTSMERAAIREGDCELSGVILMLKKIADFENELRAGNAGKDGSHE